MKAIITGLPEWMDDRTQQLVGSDWLKAMFYRNLPVDGVHVEFKYEAAKPS